MNKLLAFLCLAVGVACAQGTHTTYLQLYKPAVHETNWGALVSGNFDAIDSIFGLSTCGDGSSAVGWNATTKRLICQTISNVPAGCSVSAGVLTCSGFTGSPSSLDPHLELAANTTQTVSGGGNARLVAIGNALNVSNNGEPFAPAQLQGQLLHIVCPTNPNCTSTNYAVQPADIHTYRSLSLETNSMTVTLPAITASYPSGARVLFHNETFTTQTVAATSPSTVLSQSSISFYKQGTYVAISDGVSNWLIYQWSPTLGLAANSVLGNDSTSAGLVHEIQLTALMINAGVFCSDAGSTDTYACNLAPAPAALTTGNQYRFKANTANTGAATINFNSLGAKTIVKMAGGITTDLADNDIRAGQWVNVVYDGTRMQMTSQLGN